MTQIMTQRQPWQLYLTSLGFMLAYALPTGPIRCVWLGKMTQHPNAFAALPLIVIYGIVPIIEAIFPYGIQSIPDQVGQAKGWSLYYRFLLWLCIPLQLGMLYMALNYWVSDLFNIWGSLVYLLSVGIYSGSFAITVAHELIHHQQPLDRALGGVLLSTVGYGSFKVHHIPIHHRYVGTPLDFVTAQRGQSLYAFWWQNFISNVVVTIRYEREKLAKRDQAFWHRDQAFWHSELLLWYFLSLLWLAIAILLGGWKGGLFWVLQALIAILTLDWTNYLQHYGLTRKQDAKGRYEPVQVHHAWSSGIFLRDLALFNLLRHGDHHANPQRHYQSLRHDDNVPQYPYNYSIMYLLAFVPPLFQRIVHPYLDRFESQQQQPQKG